WAGLGRARVALGCLFLTGIPLVPVLEFMGVMGPFQVLDALITQGLLGFVGIESVRSGVVLSLSHGAIEIDSGCSSLIPLWLLGKLAMGWALVVNLSWSQGLGLVIAALGIAFGVNGIRLCLLAVLSEPAQAADFYFWHQGGGAELCSTVAIVAFGLVAGWMYYRRERDQTPVED
ncbi:MAG: exosortase/archaeosortase family protein, partial [Oscillatoriales cyanobacterium SM2_2_1]|nr:exosortase/archaeosortase family protein [Oscillatoriales cyanobacterium SM2_2_1]